MVKRVLLVLRVLRLSGGARSDQFFQRPRLVGGVEDRVPDQGQRIVNKVVQQLQERGVVVIEERRVEVVLQTPVPARFELGWR